MNTGIILPHISMGEPQYFIIKNINQYVSTTTDDVSIFSSNISTRVMEPHCGVLPVSDISSMRKGMLLATDIDGCITMLRSVTPSRKVFFVWNLEWIWNTVGYNTLRECLGQDEVVVVARCDDHAKAIENIVGKRTIHIMEEFNLERLHEICERE